MKVAILLVALLVLVSGCAQEAVKKQGEAFGANIPAAWRQVTVGQNRVYEITAGASIDVKVVDTVLKDVESAFSKVVSYYESFDGYKVIEAKKTAKLGDLDALTATVDFLPVEGYGKRAKLVVAFKDGKYYSAVYSAAQGEFYAYLPQVDGVLASFVV